MLACEYYPPAVRSLEDVKEVDQSKSKLLTLPKEVRQLVIGHISTGNVIHVSERRSPHGPDYREPASRRKYNYNFCVAPQSSLARPAGQNDYQTWTIKWKSDISNLKQICRLIYFDTLSYYTDKQKAPMDILVQENALQFSNLTVASEWLFSMPEYLRSSVGHLRIAMPYFNVLDDQMRDLERGKSSSSGDAPERDMDEGDHWEALCNYLSNPWTRESVSHQSGHRDEWNFLTVVLSSVSSPSLRMTPP